MLLFNRLMPEQENYPQVIAEIVGQLVSGNRVGADRIMAGIAYRKQAIRKRPSISRPLMVRVFRRDCWTCRYCGGRTVFSPVMPLLGVIFPEHFPYHSHWKAGQTHPAVAACSAVVDHVVPGALGGAWLEESNLATACWPCNVRKGDLTLEQLSWELRAVEVSSWDGLTGFYRQLWEIAGRPIAESHPQWLRALSDPTTS
jgi:HNH endonuclease